MDKDRLNDLYDDYLERNTQKVEIKVIREGKAKRVTKKEVAKVTVQIDAEPFIQAKTITWKNGDLSFNKILSTGLRMYIAKYRQSERGMEMDDELFDINSENKVVSKYREMVKKTGEENLRKR